MIKKATEILGLITAVIGLIVAVQALDLSGLIRKGAPPKDSRPVLVAPAATPRSACQEAPVVEQGPSRNSCLTPRQAPIDRKSPGCH